MSERLIHLFDGVSAVESELGFWFERVLVLTNLDAAPARDALARRFKGAEFLDLAAGAAQGGAAPRPA